MKAETKALLLSKKRGRAELIAFIAYIIGTVLISVFHEPWFDEAQAWSIAKSASYKDLLFTVSHYEGHPPLWYLILSPFAKLGAPFEISLKAVNLALCAAAVWFILYKSPFPKIVRCIIPFTFYFFYQTAVISRPYSLMLLAMTLAASGYKTRNEHPLRYVLPLMILCGSHAYGIVLAGGLCLVWTFEIFSKAVREHKVRALFTDKRCLSLLAILVLALLLIASVLPASDVDYINADKDFSYFLKRSYLIFVYPIDSLFGIYIDIDTIKQSTSGLITTVIGGVLLLAFIISVTHKNKKLAVFAVPYFTFLIFGHFNYLYWNHLGISTFFLLFTAWTVLDDDFAVPDYFEKIKVKTESKMTVVLGKVLIAGIVLMPLSWTVCCSVMDILEPYGPREAAQYIKDNGIEGRTVMMYWPYSYKERPMGFLEDFQKNMYFVKDNRTENTVKMGYGSTLSAYLGKNIFYNFNSDDPDKMYMEYRICTEEELERDLESWRKYGYPEYMFCMCALNSVFPELKYTEIEEMYELEAEFENHCFYKFSDKTEYVQIYKLKDEYKGGSSK